MRISTIQLFRQGVDAIGQQQVQVARTQNQISRGVRILSPADDPAGAKRLLDLQQTLALTEQYQTNANAAMTRLSLEESTLGSVTGLLNRVRELAIQANNGTLHDPDRAALAREIEERLGELLGLANTKDGNNEYLFAGLSTGTRPFSPSGSDFVYNGDQGQRQLRIGPSLEMAVGDPGSAVFQAVPDGNGTFRVRDAAANTGTGIVDAGNVLDPVAFVPDTYTISFTDITTYQVQDSSGAAVASGTFTSGIPIAFGGVEITITGTPAVGDTFEVVPSTSQDMFTTLDQLTTALRTRTAEPSDLARVHNAINRALVDLDRALENVDSVRASVGARLNAVDSERAVLEDYALHLETAMSGIRDLDLAEAVARLTQQSTALEAAQRSFAAMQRLSLFDFL